ncbi:hypothetical protein MAP00_007265 [Monascus purpureus]|nr:hypothetical protein MAP00_007265 [Monascus purpureus]
MLGIDLHNDPSTPAYCPEQDLVSSSPLLDLPTLYLPQTRLPFNEPDSCSDHQSPIAYHQGKGSPSIHGHSPTNTLKPPGDTLEETKGLTAHFLGLSSDQDADLLSSFRSNILNETSYVDVNIRQVFAGDSAHNLPPIHFNIVHDLFPERDNRIRQRASERIEEYVQPHADALVRLYFRFVHPSLPVLSKARFLQSYCENRLGIPASLRGVIYGLACSFWDRDETLSPLPALHRSELFENAHAALLSELDSPKLATLQSCLLIIHDNPPMTHTTESPRNWTLACQATSCAQSLGLHMDPSLWNIPMWEKCLRKKLWWATFVTDKWSTMSHGNPSHIPQSSFNTMDVTLDDILCDEDVTCSPYAHVLLESDHSPNLARARSFYETVRLAKQLSTLLHYSFTIRSNPLLPTAGTEPGVIDHSVFLLKSELDTWYSTLPRCLKLDLMTGAGDICSNGPLHLAFFAVKALVLRVIMSPATTLAKSNSCSNLNRYFQSSLEEFKPFVTLVTSIKPADLNAFWGRNARTHLVHCGNFLIYLFLCASTVEQVQESYSLLEAYHHALRFLATTMDNRGMRMLRPALLRIESFFQEALEIMRKGTSGD